MDKKVLIGILLTLIFGFAIAGYAQQVDPSIPLKIAHQYRNDYKFEDALEWYEKVINDFPETQAAAEACLSRIAILHSQTAAYNLLAQNFGVLVNVKLDEALNYASSKFMLEAQSEADKLDKKKNSYEIKVVKDGKKLREEYYRFEKDYARFIEKLPVPWLPSIGGGPYKPTVNEDDARRILTLGLVSTLESKSRIEDLMKGSFAVFCLAYMGFGGEAEYGSAFEQWISGKYTGKINQEGFYFQLGIGLFNSHQFKAALSAFDKVLDLTSDSPYNKLRYESEKEKKKLISGWWRKYLATAPAEAQEFAEKLAQKAPGTTPAKKVTNEIESIPQVKRIDEVSLTEDTDLTKEYQPQLMELKQKFLNHNGKLLAKGYYTDFMESHMDTLGLGVDLAGANLGKEIDLSKLSITKPRAYIVKIENKSYLGIGYIYYKATLNSFNLDNRRRVAFIITEIVIPEILLTINVFPNDVKISGIFLYVSYFHKDFTDEFAKFIPPKAEEIQVWIPYSIYSACMRNEITDQELIEKSAILVMSDTGDPDIAPVRIQVKLSD